MGAVRSNGKF
jgi:hypothetical protein